MEISDLIGKTLVDVIGMVKDSQEIRFITSDGKVYSMYHEQYCCEAVDVYDVCGDREDLIGTPILEARESSSHDSPEGVTDKWDTENQTWTFYTLRTIKGSVDIRWYGESNGYYSEAVNFELVRG